MICRKVKVSPDEKRDVRKAVAMLSSLDWRSWSDYSYIASMKLFNNSRPPIKGLAGQSSAYLDVDRV